VHFSTADDSSFPVGYSKGQSAGVSQNFIKNVVSLPKNFLVENYKLDRVDFIEHSG